MAVSISLSITQNSQSVTNNTSNVTVKVTAKCTGGSYNALGTSSGSITIDGTKYSFSNISYNTGESSSWSGVVMTKTVNVSHNSDGTKTLSCSASFVTRVSSGTVSCSGSKTLTTIPRKSSLTVANGTLGTAQTLKITEQDSSMVHKLTYKCGSVSGYILGSSSATSTALSVEWTPDLTLAKQNTTGTSVSITFTLYTYHGTTQVGSNAYTKTFSIPASVKPTVSIAVSDPTGYDSKYGAYVQGESTLKIVATASGSQGSTIKTYKTEADGKTYTAASVTSGVIAGTGTLTIKTTVTDSRGRTATASTTVSVLAYSPPKISALSVYRCDAAGIADSSGAYLAVKFSSVVTSLNNKNTASYAIQYKKSTETSYPAAETLTDFAGQYSVSDGVFVFLADTASSYDIILTVKDDFKDIPKATSGSSVKKVWSLLKKAGSIVGIAFNKIAEYEGVFEIGFQTLFTGGIRHPVLKPETDLDDVRTPNTYVGADVSRNNYGHCPLTSGTFTLEVVGMGEEGQVKQRLTYCHKTASRTWERIYYSSAWGVWICVSDFDGQLLWDGAFFMHGTQEITFAEPVSKQRTGIVLVFSRYSDSTAQDYHFTYHFVPKMAVAMHGGCGSCFDMGISQASSGSYFASKYLYISDQTIKGNDLNDDVITSESSGIKYTNNATVLRYVIGV